MAKKDDIAALAKKDEAIAALEDKLVAVEGDLAAAEDRADAAELKIAELDAKCGELADKLVAADQVAESRSQRLGDAEKKAGELESKLAAAVVGQVPAATEPKAPEGAVLAVRAVPAGGFCRAGRRWPAKWTYVKGGELTDAQILAVVQESKLETRKLGQ